MKRICSRCVRSASMIPLMPSPGIPKTVSTPQSISVSIRTSAAVLAIGTSGEAVGRHRRRCHVVAPRRGGLVVRIDADRGVRAAIAAAATATRDGKGEELGWVEHAAVGALLD